MRGLLYLLTFLLFGWILLSSYLYTCWIAGQCSCNTAVVAQTPPAIPPAAVKKGPSFVVENSSPRLASEEHFEFDKAGAKPYIPTKTRNVLGQLASVLKRDKNKEVLVTGQYTKEEKAQYKKDLGLDRASSIRAELVKSGVNAKQIKTKSLLVGSLPIISNKVRGGITARINESKAAATPAASPIVSVADKDINVKFDPPIRYKENGNVPDVPAPAKANLTKLAKHLKAQPDKVFEITGVYAKSEKYKGPYDNLGLDRAEKLKERVVKLGAKSRQVTTKSRQVASLKFDKENKYPSWAGKLLKIEKPASVSADVEKDITVNNRKVYFETNKSSVKLSYEFLQYLENVKAYLKEKKGSSVLVTGHTDADGDANANLNLSRKRANFIKSFLGKEGIPAARIKTDGKGETKPIASNDNTAGKKQNRRVEIIVRK